MKRISTLIALFFTINSYANLSTCENVWTEIRENSSVQEKYKHLIGKCNDDLMMGLYGVTMKRHRPIGYKSAKKAMFGTLDQENGKVCSVYSSECLRTRKVPNHRIMNAEHTWPKSKGAGKTPAVSDLHHLYPCNSKVNSIRSSYPFCEVEKVEWTNGLSSLGIFHDQGKCFEPPVDHRGNIARSMLYFSVRYNKRISNEEERWFKKWNIEDPVDQKEKDRNNSIYKRQKNTNPFIDHPELVNAISDF